ncbi:MAG: type II toxin-antitoxin system HicB family antitoxin [Pirellulales bacterium]|nr:type II toxin-antitoxin system HicB family antitoxin [Pirellulales bacterium]
MSIIADQQTPSDLFSAHTDKLNWENFEHGRVLNFRIFIVPEEEAGGYSVFAADLPGAASQGETVEEAVSNIREVLTELVQYYIGELGHIPWGNAEAEVTNSTIEKWILVNA